MGPMGGSYSTKYASLWFKPEVSDDRKKELMREGSWSPIHHQLDENRWICVNEATEEVLSKGVAPKGPDGKTMQAFVRYPALLLNNHHRDRDGDNYYQAGDIYEVEMHPGGTLCLLDGMTAFCSNAKLGTDFVFAPGKS